MVFKGEFLGISIACAADGGDLSLAAMKQPLINVEEKIDRFVGRRTKIPDALSTKTSKRADAIAWQKAFGGLRVRRGVYRFRSHEEADEWLWRTMTRPNPS
jgi:hypothetical protein